MNASSDLIIGSWGARFLGFQIPCAVGRSGIGRKEGEGDGITPSGIFRITDVLLRPDRVDLRQINLAQRPIGITDLWSDDPKDPYYNHPIKGLSYKFSHEKLRRSDPLYDAIGVLDFNYPNAEPGAGSAIFLHVWRKPRHPTEGCVAFQRSDLLWIFNNWKPWSRVIIRA